MTQPNLVLCIAQDGTVRVESSVGLPAGFSESAANASCIAPTLAQQCGSCVDVPISMTAIRTELPPGHSPEIIIGSPFISADILLQRASGVNPLWACGWIAFRDDSHFSKIRTTVLLI